MNIRFSGVHVTLVISPTDLRGGFHRLCSLAQDQLGINLSSGKEAVVFLSKTRKICKIVTTDALKNSWFESVSRPSAP